MKLLLLWPLHYRSHAIYIHCTLGIQNVNLHLILLFIIYFMKIVKFLNFTVLIKNRRKRNLSLKHDFI